MGEEGRTMIPDDRGRNEMDMAFSGLGLASHSRLQMGNGWMDFTFWGEKRKTGRLWGLMSVSHCGGSRDFRR